MKVRALSHEKKIVKTESEKNEICAFYLHRRSSKELDLKQHLRMSCRRLAIQVSTPPVC